jgi:hypothetical protein
MIVSPIIVHEVDKLEVVPHPALVIVLVMCWRNLHSTSTEGHVDGDGVGDDGNAAVDERVDGELAMEVLKRGGGGQEAG